jgi:hypothetical protein
MAESLTERGTRARPGGAPASPTVSGLGIAASLLALFLVLALPVLLTRVPPIGDYVGHLARIYVIDFGRSDPFIDAFYEVNWQIIPNLAIDLVVAPLARLIDLEPAGRLYILAYLALTLTGAEAIHYAAFRRWSLGPLVAALFFYNQVHLYGLVNYVFGIGVALWAVASFMWMRTAAPGRRVAVSLVFVVVLFFCHLFALGLYGMTLLAIEASWAWRTRPGRGAVLREALVFGGPFLAAAALMALSPTAHFVSETHWTLASKAQGLILALKTYDSRIDGSAAAAMVAGLVWAWRRGILGLHPAGVALLAVALPVYLALPLDFLSAWGVDIRLPIAVVLMLAGFLEWRFTSRLHQAGFLAAVVALTCVRVGTVEAAWRQLDRIEADMDRSMAAIPRGSKILVALADHPDGSYALNEAVQEMPMWAMVERSSFVSAEFTHPGQQVLAARPAVRDLAADFVVLPTVSEMLAEQPCAGRRDARFSKVYWQHWDKRFDFVYVLLIDADAPNPDPDRLALAYAGERFQLYAVRR